MAINWNFVKSEEFLAQAGHAMLGGLLVFGPRALHDGWVIPAITTTAGFFYMFVKEFAYDIYLEKESVAIGWKDIAFFALGATLAWGAIIGFGRL